MNILAEPFGYAFQTQNGYFLAEIISPIPPERDGGRLYAVYRSSNPDQIKRQLRYELSNVPVNHDGTEGLSQRECDAWVDVFAAYWNAVGEILRAEEATNRAKNMGNHSVAAADWVGVYEAWKQVLNAVFRGYQSSIFEAWTIPCLYMTSKYLRVFAIKADETINEKKGGAGLNAGYEDDLSLIHI